MVCSDKMLWDIEIIIGDMSNVLIEAHVSGYDALPPTIAWPWPISGSVCPDTFLACLRKYTHHLKRL